MAKWCNQQRGHVTHQAELVCSGCYNKTLQTGWLEQWEFIIVLEAGSSRPVCSYGQVLMKVVFLAFRQLPPRCVLTFWGARERKRERMLPGVSPNEDTNPIMGTLPS